VPVPPCDKAGLHVEVSATKSDRECCGYRDRVFS
jgi:hypothetical protein